MKNFVKNKILYDSRNRKNDLTYNGSYTSLRASGRIRKRIILGEKYNYGGKAKEKENYVLFVAGQGQEKTQIEEIEQIIDNPRKKEKIVEEREIVDNYQYHEIKDIKNTNQRNSETYHQRLCSPFERNKLKKYEIYVSEPRQSEYKMIKKTDLVVKQNYSRNSGQINNYNQNNSYIYKTQNIINNQIKNNDISNIYERKDTLSRNQNMNISNNSINHSKKMISYGKNNIYRNNNYQRKEFYNGKRSFSHNQINFIRPKEIFIPQKVISFEYQEQPIDNPIYYRQDDLWNNKNDERFLPEITIINGKKGSKIQIPIRKLIFEDKTKKQLLYEGSKYQNIVKERPKSGNYARKNLIQPKKKLNKNLKGIINYKEKNNNKINQVALIGKIPRPKPQTYIRNIIKRGEGFFPLKYEKNSSYTDLSQTTENTSRSNIGNLNEIEQRSLKINRSFAKLPNYKVINSNIKKIPNKDIINGRNSEYKEIELSSDFNSGMRYTEYYKNDQNNNENKFNKNFYGDNFFYNDEDEFMLQEVYCPVHGKQIIKMFKN